MGRVEHQTCVPQPAKLIESMAPDSLRYRSDRHAFQYLADGEDTNAGPFLGKSCGCGVDKQRGGNCWDLHAVGCQACGCWKPHELISVRMTISTISLELR